MNDLDYAKMHIGEAAAELHFYFEKHPNLWLKQIMKELRNIENELSDYIDLSDGEEE